MPVILRCSDDLPAPAEYRTWFAVTGIRLALDARRKLPRLAERLEHAFVAERETWWRLGHALAEEPTADIALRRSTSARTHGSIFLLRPRASICWRERTRRSRLSTCAVTAPPPPTALNN